MRSNSRKPVSFRATLLIYSLIITALPILLVGLIILYVVMENMKQEISANTLLLTRSLASEVREFLVQPLNLLQQVDEILIRSELVASDKQNAYLEKLVKNYPFMEQVMVINHQGRVTAVAPYDANIDGIDMSGMDFFKTTLAQKKPSWSPTFIPPQSSQPTLSISIPSAQRVIAGYLNLASLGDIVDKFNTGTARSAFIVDNKGTVIAHPNRGLVAQRWNLNYFGNIAKGLAGKEGVFAYQDNGKQYLGGVAVVPGVNWVVHISQPLDVAYAPVYRIGLITVVGMILSICIAMVISVPVMRKILNPLLELTEQSGHIARGDYRPVRFKSTFQELHELSESFNLMVSAVQKREDQLRQSEAQIQRHSVMLEDSNRELKIAKESAEAANRAKTAFLASMSHELRTPLNAILGFSQLMQRDTLLPLKVQKEAGIVNRCGQHLLELINDILEIAKIEAGRIALNSTSFDLHWFLKGIQEIFASAVTTKDIHFTVAVEPDLVRHVHGDEGKLRQVLINLLGNAVKFTQAGGIELRVQNKLVNGQSLVRFEIEDTGIGIPPEDLEKIFDPFVQSGIKGAESDFAAGTGLGLAISRQYIRLMGGEIRVESTPGRGSVFSFEIPVQVVVAKDVVARPPLRQAIALAPNQPVYRILTVEDQEENRTLLIMLLESMGFAVKAAVNGREGVEIFSSWEPDLVFMDMRMPVMDGYEATRRIKMTEKGSKTPVIALTAHAFEEERDRILAAGCDDFIGKPFRANDIFDTIGRHLGVEYLYDEWTASATPPAQAPPADIPSLGVTPKLPEDMVMLLKDAIVAIDTDMIRKCIDLIKDIDGSFGETLSRLADNFQYDRILTMIDSGRG